MIHLDTNVVIDYLRGDQRVSERLSRVLPDVAISTIVLAELLYGARRSARAAENSGQINRFLLVAPPVDFDAASAAAYSDAKWELEKMGKPTSEVDLVIASIALARGATLVTRNRRHFESLPKLKLDDWAA